MDTVSMLSKEEGHLMMKMQMQRDLLQDQQTLQNLKQSKHIDMFWDKWIKGGQSGKKEGSAWEEWLSERGLLPGADSGDSQEVQANGWSEPIDEDLSEMEDDAWISGGMKRPGERDSEEFSSEEVMGDDWEDDDDDHGGEMMPIPSM